MTLLGTIIAIEGPVVTAAGLAYLDRRAASRSAREEAAREALRLRLDNQDSSLALLLSQVMPPGQKPLQVVLADIHTELAVAAATRGRGATVNVRTGSTEVRPRPVT